MALKDSVIRMLYGRKEEEKTFFLKVLKYNRLLPGAFIYTREINKRLRLRLLKQQ